MEFRFYQIDFQYIIKALGFFSKKGARNAIKIVLLWHNSKSENRWLKRASYCPKLRSS